MDELQDMAYMMVSAYDETKNKDNACSNVERYYPDVDKDIISGMWAAIDAYINAGREME